MKPFHVYLLNCGDGSYYCGHTDNLEARLYQHEVGKVGYTAGCKPLTLAWQAEFEKREEALAFERQIKGWSRAKKEALITGDWQKISRLAQTRQGVSSADALRHAQGERINGVALAQGVSISTGGFK